MIALLLLMDACVAPPTPSALPDLKLGSIYTTYAPGAAGCWPTRLETRIEIRNSGLTEVAAGALLLLNGVTQTLPSIPPEGSITITRANTLGSRAFGLLDATQRIDELDEDNNRFDFSIPEPSRPVSCTPTPVLPGQRTSRPDLVLGEMSLLRVNAAAACGENTMGARVEVRNVGDAIAPAGATLEINDARRLLPEIAPGMSYFSWEPDYKGGILLMILRTQAVMDEADKTNNAFHGFLLVPTPRPSC